MRTENGTTIGQSPAGVEWVCYHDDPEKVERMTKALIGHWNRTNLRVRNLTDNQVDHIYWCNELCREYYRLPEGVCTYGRTYVDAPREFLVAALDRLGANLVDEDVFASEKAVTEQEVEFSIQRQLASLEATCKKLRKALRRD